MIGFHYQGNSDGWTDAVRRLPSGAPVKFVDGVQRCAEAKAANPGVYTVVRHHVGEQNPGGDLHEQARRFFASFVDGSFLQIARHVDAVQEWNEYFADSQSAAEKARWVAWVQAAVDVWRDEYRTRPELAHIDLILAETAVGNDIPSAVAKIAHENPFCVLGYHPYIPVHDGHIHPEHWRWYSGRWHFMDMIYRAQGYRVRWFFGEFGAVGVNGEFNVNGVWPNSLAASDGWWHPRVYAGKVDPYLDMMTEWMTLVEETPAWQDGRVIGATIFTSGGGSMWKDFEVRQPEMSIIADHIADIMDDVTAPEPPPIVVPPPPVVDRGKPRVQYSRLVHVVPQDTTKERWMRVAEDAFYKKQTVGFSYDDAGVGDLDSRTAVLHGLRDDQRGVFTKWYETNYAGTVVQFADWPQTAQDAPNSGAGVVIDVSHWQGIIDWQRAASAGVTHAYIKATEGKVYLDSRFYDNLNAARSAGIEVGAYHYFKNAFTGYDQARYFISKVGRPLDLPAVLDIEDGDGSPDTAVEQQRIWLEMVRDAFKVQPVVYTAAWYWNEQRLKQRVPWAKDYRLWVADYTDAAAPVIPKDWDSYWLWQYGQTDGGPYGVLGKVDVNRWA